MIDYTFKMFLSFFIFHLFYNLSSHPPKRKESSFIFNGLFDLDNKKPSVQIVPWSRWESWGWS
jgi:hypothetical protein